MKNLFTLLSHLRGSMGNLQSKDVRHDCRLTVGSPSGFNSKLMLKLVSVLVLILTIGSGNVWAQTTTTYTFSSKSWAASPANWTNGKAGNALTSGQGIQVTTGTSGANGTSPKSFTNVSKVVITYSTNASKGAGSIAVKIGSNTANSQNVTKTGGTTDRTLTYNFSPNQTGNVNVTVTCTTNSIYVKSVAITEAAATKTYHEWNGSNKFTTSTGGSTLKAVQSLCDWAIEPYGWCSEENYASSTYPTDKIWFEDASWPAGKTDLYALYRVGSSPYYYSTKPTIYTITYNLTNASKDDEYSYSCMSDMVDVLGTSNFYGYFKPATGYILDESSISITMGGSPVSSSNYSWNPEYSYAGYDYTAELYMENITGNVVVTVTGKSCTPLAAPTGLTLSTDHQGTAGKTRFGWNAVSGATGYKVTVTKGSVSNSVTTASDRYYYITTFPDGEYTWTVQALGDGSTYCAEGTVANGTPFSYCHKDVSAVTPTVNATTSITKTGATANWTAVLDADHYTVKVYAGATATGSAVKTYTNVTGTSQAITGLTAGTQYCVTVQAHDACSHDSQIGTGGVFTTTALTLYTVTFHNAAGSAPGVVTQTAEGGTVSIPSASACEGWTFVGWKVGGSQSSTTTDPTSSGTWITSASWPKNYAPEGNIDVYAVFSKTEGGGVAVTDELTPSAISNPSSYSDWSDKSLTSNAVYAGQSSGGDSYLQLRSKNSNSGVVMTTSGGNVTKVAVTWSSSTQSGRTLNVYGKNSAYSAATDLYNASNQGTLIGTIVCGTSTELDITKDYAFIGFRSDDGAMYLDEVDITIGGGGATTWRSDPPCSTAKLDHITITTPPTTTNYLVGQVFSSAGAVVTAYYDDDSHHEVTASWTPTTPLTAGTGKTVMASYTEGEVTKTATTTINVYAVTLQKKDNTGATISGALNETPAVSVSVAALSAAASGNQYVFKEWQISGGTLGSSAETTSNTIATVTGPVTVTAVYWKPITVKWYVNGSQYGATGTYSYGWNVQYPASPAPESVGCTGKVFIGWSRTSMYRSDTKPTDLVESGESLTSNENFYAIFADKISDGTPPTWTKTALGSVSAGTYLICMSDGKVFNGNISSGHGQVTSSVFATSLTSNTTINEDAPAGACEVTFAAVTNGFTMNVPGKGYLYAKGTKTGNLDYHETESEYWFSANSFWRYHGQNTSGTYVALYDYAHTQFKNSVTTSGTDVYEIILLKKTNAGVPATYSDYTTSCTCSEYQFHYQHNSSWNTENICFSPVAGATNNYLTEEMALPYAEWYKVTWQGNDQSYTAVKGFSGTTDNIPMPFYHNRGKSFGVAPQNGNIGGGKGRFHVYHDSGSTNKYVSFVPTGYTLNFGTGDTWTNDLTLNFTGKTSNWDETEWYTDIVTLTNSQIGKKIFVGLQTETGYVWCDPYSQKDNLSGLRTKSGSGESWVSGGMSTSYPNKTGKFRIYADSGDKNWYVTFVPYYHLVYDANGGSGAPAASDYVSCEETAANRTIAISATEPTRANYRFMGWATSTERAAAGTVDYKYGTANNSIVLTGEQTLYAVWKQVYTVTYNYAGGTGTCSNGEYIEGEAVTVCASTPTKAGSDFNGWSYSPSVTVSAGAFTMPASNVVITATWTDHTYVLNHSGSNYTNTENQTTIKSGDTPLTLHYTCAGTYGFPNSISISGGGKSWTVGTDYTWSVSADKKSATLVINATTITADVTIAITMSTLYTVTYVHHDKGIFSGASTTESVRSDDNVITLPTVTSVSCGFYDTFEGWIVSGSEYSESTSKPATVYAGGSSYTVTGDVTLRALYSKCEGDGGEVYAKVTTDPGDWSGTYLIINENYGKAMNGSETQANLVTTSNNVAVTISNSQVVSNSTTDTYAFTIAPHSTASGRYSIRSYSGYYIGSNSASNAINATPTETTYSNAISISDGVLTIGCGQYKNSVEYRLMFMGSGSGSPIFKYYPNTQGQVCLYKKQSLCTKSYATNPSCVKPVGVHIVYNANAGDATMSCNNHNRTYKVQDEVNQYPKLASAYSFCTDATRDGYTLVGWNTQTNGLGTTYELGTNYSNLPVSGELDGENWVTLTVYAMWAPSVKFNLGNATGGTGVPAVVEEDGGFMLPTPTAAQLGTIPCDYTFYAWSESSVTTTPTKPTVFLPGTKYTGAARTLYAVYRKGEAGSNPDLFSLSYTIGATKYYVGAVQDTREEHSTKFNAVTDAEQATVFGMKSINGQTYKSLYWMNDETREYMYWKDNGAGFQFTSTEDDYYGWNISGTTTLSIASVAKGGYASRTLSGSTTEIGCPSTPNAATSFTKEEATSTTYTYDTNPTCFTTATFQFVTNGGTINNPTAYTDGYYTDITIGENRYLPTATYPGEWTFEGWMKGSEVADTDMRPESVNFIEVTLNTTTYTASTVGTTYFYAVYSKTVNDKQFDPVNGGTYKLFAIMADGTTKKYMPAWGGTQTTLSPVTSCASTGDYTITPGTGEHAGQYKITHGTYTLGVVGEDDTKFKNVADAWWDIEPSTSGKGTWRIKIHGSSTRCMALSGTGYFSNTIISGFVNNPSQAGYRDMEIGECIYTEYTSTPENIPYITITGSPVKITSTNGERVYASSKIHVEAHNFTGVRTIHLSATNGFATNPASVKTAANGAYSGDVDVYYQPTTVGDGSIVSSVLTAEQTAGTTEEQISQTFSALQGRNMPAKFVIAAKIGGQWYAMPDDKTTTETMTALPIEVNDADAPTSATLVPHNVEWSLSDVVNSNDRPKDKVYLYESNKMKDDGVTPWNYALYAGTAPTIGTYGQVSGISGTSSDRYEWGLTTSDLLEYTISNATVGKNISISNAGNFGTHASAIASSTLFLLPIENYYELAEMQAVEWKANSIVVMFRGAGSKATAKLGAGAEGSAQSLTSVKKDHGVYEIATGDLTSAAGQSLAITIKNSSDVVLGRKLLVVPAIVSVNKNSDALGVTTDAAAATDVVVLDGATLSAAATKYTFKNITVYPGGKLVIGADKQLGMASLTLRGGSSWGAATYEHKYPQFVVNNTTSGAYTNSAAVINYDYVTTKDQYYSFVLPYNGSTAAIKYPVDIYGSAVSASNTGSFEFQYYDGAARATGATGWKVLAEPATLVAGTGYTFLGMPKKVDAYDGSDSEHANTRQRYGIHRIPMSVAANAVQSGETADKNITIAVALATKNNDSGWNLIGNPYMSDVSGLSNTDIQVGKLVHSDTNPWDGKWKWDNPTTGVRYIVTTDDGQTFESQQASTATLTAFKNFFVQIQNEEANTLVIPANSRKDKNLAPARYKEEAEKDIMLAVDLVSDERKDKVDLLINDIYTAEFDQDGDFTKMMNSTKLNIYGVYPGDNLSFIAVDKTTAANSIPIGYQVPAGGDYTLQLSDRDYVMADAIEALYVTDHEVSPEITTDLLENPYNFHVNNAETNDTRFTISIKLKEQKEDITTGVNAVDVVSEKPVKFIYQDKIYILIKGVIYDATGKKVSEINK